MKKRLSTLSLLLAVLVSCVSKDKIAEYETYHDKMMVLHKEYNELEKKLEATSTDAIRVWEFVEEIHSELRSIDLNTIELTDPQLETPRRQDLRKDIRERLKRAKELINERNILLRRMEVATRDLKGFDELVSRLEKKLEAKEKEVKILLDQNHYQRSRTFDCREENLVLKETNLKLWLVSQKRENEVQSMQSQVNHLKNTINLLNDQLSKETRKSTKNHFVLVNTKGCSKIQELPATLLPIPGSKVRVISDHRRSIGSYHLGKGKDAKTFLLEIISPTNFWSCGRLLVIYTNSKKIY